MDAFERGDSIRTTQAGTEPDGADPARLLKRSMVIAGHHTSISLENIFWTALKSIAAGRGQSIAGLVARIDETRGGANLSSAIRVFVLAEALQPATMERAPETAVEHPAAKRR